MKIQISTEILFLTEVEQEILTNAKRILNKIASESIEDGDINFNADVAQERIGDLLDIARDEE